MNRDLVSVRYLVDEVAAAFALYTKHLGFEELTNFSPAFADVVRGNLRLLLSGRRARPGEPCPTAGYRRLAVGTGSISSSTTSPARSNGPRR